MAGTSLFALLDDIATLLDDVSAMTKVAAHKTAGVLGDDLALNAQQVSGVRAERELPVVWAVALGSLRNKAILVPAALLISAFMPWLITPLLMLGGAFLCFEGAEALAERFLHPQQKAEQRAALREVLVDPQQDLREFEREKIQGAIRTDFILSAEIIVITLGTAAEASLSVQVAVLVGIAIAMTVGVYGLVAGIVKLDDAGLWLSQRAGALARAFGRGVLAMAPKLMTTLKVVGTAAMFLVGGGILVHGLPPIAEVLHGFEHLAEGVPHVGSVLGGLSMMLLNGLFGVMAGALLVAGMSLIQKLRGGTASAE